MRIACAVPTTMRSPSLPIEPTMITKPVLFSLFLVAVVTAIAMTLPVPVAADARAPGPEPKVLRVRADPAGLP